MRDSTVDAVFLACPLAAVALLCVMLPITAATGASGAASAAGDVPGEIVVGFAPGPVASVAELFASRMGIRAASRSEPSIEVLRLPRGVSVAGRSYGCDASPGSPTRRRTTSRTSPGPGSRTIPASRIAPEAGR